MKNLNEKKICARAAAVMTAMSMMMINAYAVGANFTDVYTPIVELINSLMHPLMAVVVAVGALYCILLGVKFAQAEEPQQREKAKAHLKNAVIGFVLIFVLIFFFFLLTPIMER
ncbi:MAG: pilin [Oscillibacter sp.]|nr:pilin [Oscillibacter sp.]